MMMTIEPCFHWVGYHVSRHLLQEGYEVIGIDPVDTPISEFLYMFVGRNSNFQHFYYIGDKEKHVQHTSEEGMIQYRDHELKLEYHGEGRSSHQFELPPLYGEWMDLESLNVGTKTELYQWVKESQAVYIDDLLSYLIPRIVSTAVDDFNYRELHHKSIKKNIENVWKAHKEIISHTMGGFI